MKTVMLLYGGRSYEHDVSVITAVQIGELWQQPYRLLPVYVRDGRWMTVRGWRRYTSYLGRVRGRGVTLVEGGVRVGGRFVPVHCALLATHGGEGEDGTLQALLQYHRVPYTSCDVLSSAVCMDKIVCKKVLRANGFPVVEGWEAVADATPPLPCICKPARLGSSIGVAVARTPDEWANAYANALCYDQRILAERFVEGAKEYNCAAVRDGDRVVVSAVERPAYRGDTYTFGEKYKMECRHELPAEIPADLYTAIQDTTARIYRALSLWGVVRVDYLYDGIRLYVNEINTIPGSLSYRMFSAVGVPMQALVSILVENARLSPSPQVDYGHLLGELVGTCK